MQFVDEATISVIAGNGGHGCLSFRREKFVPFGGPNGGDGGDGGSVYFIASSKLHTLVDFRYQKQYKAANGQCGSGNLCTGKSGDDLIIEVPIGTVVWEADTGEQIGDLTRPKQQLLVAKGGMHGLGNYRFKSSTNRAPRKITKGEQGEQRNLKLELKLLADVGLLGLPNAGKSTLIRSVSAAVPKVADYPFTTLQPHLGVVKVGSNSFVVADVPGLITGAATGVGLGVRFLKHLSRTTLLLHVVDVAPMAEDIASQISIIEQELQNYDATLAAKPRWLVMNKIDLLTESELSAYQQTLAEQLKWDGPIFWISAIKKTGVTELCRAIVNFMFNQGEANG